MNTKKIYATIGQVFAISEDVATEIASALAGLGITNIEFNATETAIIFTLSNGTKITLPIQFLMSQAVYVDNTGTGTVRNSGKLGEQAPTFYTNSSNISYDKTGTQLTSTMVQAVITELATLIKTNTTNITALQNSNNSLNNSVNSLNSAVTSLNNSQANQDGLIAGHTTQLVGITDRLTSTEAETQANYAAHAQIIGGAYLGSVGDITIDKTKDGCKVNSTIIDNKIKAMGTTAQNISDDLTLHQTSQTAHFGVVEYKNEKGAINGYPPLDSNGKMPIKFLYTSAPTTAIITYPTNSSTAIPNPQSTRNYTERANSKTDSRYPVNEVTLTAVITSTTTTYADVGAGLIDAGILVGTFNNLTALSFMRYKCDMAGAKLRLEFYKRTSAGVETKIATSVEVTVQQSGTFVSLETQTLFQNFTMTATDRIAIKWTILKPVGGALNFVTALGGQSPTYTSLVSTNGTGGSTTPIRVNDVIGLPQVFDGSTAITDLKVTGQPYNLKDFMAFSRITNPNSIYVSSGSSNGTGDRFTPFGTLTYALAATSDSRKDIEIMDIGTYALPVNPDTTKVDNFMAHRAIITGDLIISKIGSMYRIGTLNGNLKVNATNSTIMIDKMVGNIEISNNCVVIISGSFTGTITIIGTITPYIRINKINTTMTSIQIEALKPKLEAGSVFGKYIFNMVSVI